MFCGDDETGVEAARTPSVSGIILAGGQARRMGGINKALIEIGGRTIIERIASTLSRVLSNILIVTNDPDSFRFLGLPMYRDAIPGSGSLGGLFTGLKVCGTDYGFLVGCDMPFLRADIISFMIGKTDDCDVIVPATGDYLEPLHALVSQRCVPHIEALIRQEDFKILNLCHQVRVKVLPERDLLDFDPELNIFHNVNSPDDLVGANELAERLARLDQYS